MIHFNLVTWRNTMKSKLLFASALLPLIIGCANAKTPETTEPAPAQPKQYNETMNPRQKEYPNHLGFNDLHIQAI